MIIATSIPSQKNPLETESVNRLCNPNTSNIPTMPQIAPEMIMPHSMSFFE